MKALKQLLKESEQKYIDIHSVDLQREYRKYAAELFDNDMPLIPIMIKPIKSGAMVEATVNRLTGKLTLKHMILSSKYKFTEERLKNVLVHEMIHVWTIHNQLRDYGGMHGVYFSRKMDEINARGGYTITVHDVGAESAIENKKGVYIFLAHEKGSQKFLMSVLDEKAKDTLSEYLTKWYDYMTKDNVRKYETYFLLSHDNELMTYPKSRMVKTLKKFIIKDHYYAKLIANSQVLRHES